MTPCSVVPLSSGQCWPWRCKQQRAPKCYPTTTLHGVTTQKTSTWIFTAVKTSNLAPALT